MTATIDFDLGALSSTGVGYQYAPCVVARALAGLSAETRSGVEALIFTPGQVSLEVLALKMRQSGMKVSQASLYRHRRGVCTCGETR